MLTVYKMVHDLSADEFAELKSNYFHEFLEQDDCDVKSMDDIPDEVIYDWYDGIDFMDEDFFCNIKDGDYEGCGAAYMWVPDMSGDMHKRSKLKEDF